MYKEIVVLALLLVSGCATHAKYEKSLQTWVGHNESELISVWGAPVRVYDAGEAKYLTYSSSRNLTIPGSNLTYRSNCYTGANSFSCNTSSVGGTPATNMTLLCETTFQIVNSKIVSWNWKGYDCRSF